MKICSHAAAALRGAPRRPNFQGVKKYRGCVSAQGVRKRQAFATQCSLEEGANRIYYFVAIVAENDQPERRVAVGAKARKLSQLYYAQALSDEHNLNHPRLRVSGGHRASDQKPLLPLAVGCVSHMLGSDGAPLGAPHRGGDVEGPAR